MATEKVKVLSIKGIIIVSGVLAMTVGLIFGLGGLPVLGLTIALTYVGSRKSVKTSIATFAHGVAKEAEKHQTIYNESTARRPVASLPGSDGARERKAGKKGRPKK